MMERRGEDGSSRFSRRGVLRLGVASGVAVTASGLLVACTDGGEPSAVRTQDAGPPQSGGTLTVGMISEGDTESVDPWAFAAATATGYLRVSNLYDTLLEFDDELGTHPALAESIEVSADKKTWTFRLRQGVSFHDGSSLTADDVLHNVQAWTDPNSWPFSSGGSEIDPKRVDKLDDLTVRIGLKEPNARFDRGLAFLAFSIKSRNETKAAKPIGTGPFTFESLDPGARSEFVRFEGHWRPDPVYLDRLVVDSSFTDENARTNALRSGQIGLVPLMSFVLAESITPQTAKVVASQERCLQQLLHGGGHATLRRRQRPPGHEATRGPTGVG
jgi:peptide/nickel transport system substrate-binding protein